MNLDENFVRSMKAGEKISDLDLQRVGLENTELRKQWALLSEEIAQRVSPPGALGLPPTLDAARCSHGIPDEAFRTQAAFERVLIWQLPSLEMGGDTYGGGPILMAETTKARDRYQAPRGVLVSAGLKALDALRSHGMDLGHVVTFLHMAPWKYRVGFVKGQEQSLLVLQVGDIMGSETLATSIRAGHVHITGGCGEPHTYDSTPRVDPHQAEDY